MSAVPKRSYHLIVRVPAVDGLTKREAMCYVRDAVRGWGGSYSLGDPLAKFSDRKKIVVATTLYQMESHTLRKLRKELAQSLRGHETYSGEHAERVDAILATYLMRA